MITLFLPFRQVNNNLFHIIHSRFYDEKIKTFLKQTNNSSQYTCHHKHKQYYLTIVIIWLTSWWLCFRWFNSQHLFFLESKRFNKNLFNFFMILIIKKILYFIIPIQTLEKSLPIMISIICPNDQSWSIILKTKMYIK